VVKQINFDLMLGFLCQPNLRFILGQYDHQTSIFIQPSTSNHKPLLQHNGENSKIANLSATEPIRNAPDYNEYIPHD